MVETMARYTLHWQPESLDMNSAPGSSLPLPADLFSQTDSEEPSDTNPATGYMVLPSLSTQPSLLPLPQSPLPSWSSLSHCSRMGPGVSQLFILKSTIDHKTFFFLLLLKIPKFLQRKLFLIKATVFPRGLRSVVGNSRLCSHPFFFFSAFLL